MNIVEVIQKANAFVLQKTGVKGDPDSVRINERNGKRTWRLFYRAELFYPPNESGKTIIDGGEYIVIVDALTGDVSVLDV